MTSERSPSAATVRKDLHDLLTGLVSSEEVGSSHTMSPRPVHEGACDGDALLLAPESWLGASRRPVERFTWRSASCAAPAPAGAARRGSAAHGHVLRGRERRQAG